MSFNPILVQFKLRILKTKLIFPTFQSYLSPIQTRTGGRHVGAREVQSILVQFKRKGIRTRTCSSTVSIYLSPIQTGARVVDLDLADAMFQSYLSPIQTTRSRSASSTPAPFQSYLSPIQTA